MLNFSLYKKKIGINKELQDYIKKTNTDNFNQIIERNKLVYKPFFLNYNNNIKNNFLNSTYISHDNKLCNLDNLSEFRDLTEIDNLYDSSNKTNNAELLIHIFTTGTKLFIRFAYLIIKKILYLQ
jgi:hypothetical protein